MRRRRLTTETLLAVGGILSTLVGSVAGGLTPIVHKKVTDWLKRRRKATEKRRKAKKKKRSR
jgi:hypothetical protein